jgi:hypothetical protein
MKVSGAMLFNLIYQNSALYSSYQIKKGETMMNVEVSKEELSLIQMLLTKEELMTRIEIHHARRTFDFRDYLKQREKLIQGLLERTKQLLPEEEKAA